MTAMFKMTGKVPNGAVLIMGIRYAGAETEAARDKIWEYALIKAGGLWYVSGTGSVPQAAGWGAIERWLGKQEREVAFVEVVTGRHRIYPEMSPDAATPDPA